MENHSFGELRSLKQIAELLGTTHEAQRRRWHREGFKPSAIVYRRGQKTHLFPISLFCRSSVLLAQPNSGVRPSRPPSELRVCGENGTPPQRVSSGSEQPCDSFTSSVEDRSRPEGTSIFDYSAFPDWSRKKADKYMAILQACQGFKGNALRSFIKEWNAGHPDSLTSYPSIMRARKDLSTGETKRLLDQRGKTAGRSSVNESDFKYFKSLYLKEGAPSLYSCWLSTLGHFRESNPSLTAEDFPSPKSFERRLKREVPEQSIFLSRHGKSAWNRKYAQYVDRDYSTLRAGECSVGDHHQLDVAARLPDGRVVFPWFTAWADFKSTKFLGWSLHPEDPNSDHIFEAFYLHAKDHGLPNDVYIDNGKDYRCRDFSGGRRVHKVQIDELRAASLLGHLNIIAHFSLAYNAQAKIIERSFLKVKELFSKHMIGYRGGNAQERPEVLKQEINRNQILPWDQYRKIFDSFILEVFNRLPSEGKALQGLSPDQLWEKDRIPKRVVAAEALVLLCKRTSRPMKVGRNGVYDSEFEFTYWAEFMSGIKGSKVYLRRDPKDLREAWVFSQEDEYLGRAFVVEQVPALARTPLEKHTLKAALKAKKEDKKTAEAYAKIIDRPDPIEIISNMAAGVSALNGGEKHNGDSHQEPDIFQMTQADIAIQQEKRMRAAGSADLSKIVPQKPEKKKLIKFESERTL